MRKFGLIGYPLTHSFSKRYFSAKFEREGIRDCQYDLYEISDLSNLSDILKQNPEIEGINVTIPYKEQVIPFLDELDPACEEIGAVNCIRIKDGTLKGYNTDYIGFQASLEAFLSGKKPNALVLGTGGASKAVVQALKHMGISFRMVSRKSTENTLTYQELKENPHILGSHQLIINTTPLGTYPKTEEMPDIDPNQVTEGHHVYDLVYNPEKTFLMRSLEARGALVKNGLEMLELQAEAAWRIWN